MSNEQCKYLFAEMKKKNDRSDRTLLCDLCPTLSFDFIKYRRVNVIILNDRGDNINMYFLQKLGLTLYAGGFSRYLLYYNYKEPKILNCPPTWREIGRILYKNNKLYLLILLYSLFSKMCRSMRDAAYGVAHGAAHGAVYAAARDAARAVYAGDAAAYGAARDAARAVYAAGDAYGAAHGTVYAAGDAYGAAAKRKTREAFKYLIKLKKKLLKELI